MLKFIILFLVSFVVFANSTPIFHENCIIGAGATGLSFGVDLKDNGHDDIIILEEKPIIGGHCNTKDFPALPGQTQNWLDIGQQGYINTVLINGTFGTWNVDVLAYIERFIPNGTFFITPATVDININMRTGETVNIPFNATEVFIALGIYESLVATNYSWVNTGVFTDPIPDELLASTYDFVNSNGFQALASTFIKEFTYTSGLGLGNLTHLAAMYLLTGMSPATLAIIIGYPAGVSFEIVGGCIQIYNGMRDYIGSSRVITNTTITNVIRPLGDHPVRIFGNTNGVNFEYQCTNLIVAHPPVLDKIGYLNPDFVETALFSHVFTNYYYTSTASLSDGPFVNSSLTISNANANSLFAAPFLTSPTSVNRNIPYGPLQTQCTSNMQRSLAEIAFIMQHGFNHIPSEYGNYTLNVGNLQQHEDYWPMFDTDSLKWSISPFAILDAIQSRRHTWWPGPLSFKISSATHIFENNYNMVQEYFPA